MPKQIALLRGINLGSSNRVAMPELRKLLAASGYTEVATYVQSGNIVLAGDLDEAALARSIAGLIAKHFKRDIPVVVRSGAELARVVAENPFPEEAASKPKALQVTFRGEPIEAKAVAALEARASASERVAALGREIYSWHPDGIARSKLAVAITPKNAVATARNWATVLTLLEMASDDD